MYRFRQKNRKTFQTEEQKNRRIYFVSLLLYVLLFFCLKLLVLLSIKMFLCLQLVIQR